MLWIIVVVLVALWVLGMATSYTLGGLIHLLFVAAMVVLVVRIIENRRAVAARR